MTNQIVLVAEAVSNEKDIDKEVIFQAIEAALAAATKKRFAADEEVSIRVAIDRDTGDYDTFRVWDVLPDDEIEFSSKQLTVKEAQERKPDAVVGDVIEEQIESVPFGRIGAQTAKQVIVQKVREAERSKIIEEYKHRQDQLINGVVKKIQREHLIIDVGSNVEAALPRDQMIPQETFRIGDRVRGYLYEISTEAKGPQLFISRACKEMLIELFKIEVPEIGDETIQIKAVARDPGSRAKIAVKTNDGRIDPIGACVGMRGARVQAVSGELGGERIDIILWDDNPAQLVINAMAPAEVASIVVDEESNTMDIAVTDEQLSQAIGRNGQNIRLASSLTGWTLNVMSSKDAEEKQLTESAKQLNEFKEKLDVDEDIAQILVAAGFTTIDEIAYVPANELLEVEGFDEEIVETLRQRANDVLLTLALADDGEEPVQKPEQDLLELAGMTEELANTLATKGIITRENLADQSVDELLELADIDENLAGKLIMAAREPWFNQQP